MSETECTPYILLGALLIYIGCLGLETCWDLWMLREYEFDIIREQSTLRYLLSLNSENRQRTRTDSRITYYLFTAKSHCKWMLLNVRESFQFKRKFNLKFFFVLSTKQKLSEKEYQYKTRSKT